MDPWNSYKMGKGRWQDEESLGGELVSDPVAVSLGNNEIHVFYRGTDKGLWHKAFI
jgi:hypothetical protein